MVLPATPHSLRSKSGSLAKFAAILRASSFVSNLAADRRPGQAAHRSTTAAPIGSFGVHL
jgi:hypothetical protein